MLNVPIKLVVKEEIMEKPGSKYPVGSHRNTSSSLCLLGLEDKPVSLALNTGEGLSHSTMRFIVILTITHIEVIRTTDYFAAYSSKRIPSFSGNASACTNSMYQLVPIVISVAIWGTQLSRKRILIQCDNMGVVAAVSKGSSKEPLAMHLLQCLWFFTAHYDTSLTIEHIPGVLTEAADHLSRNNLIAFRIVSPHAGSAPSNHSSTRAGRISDQQHTILDMPTLQAAVQLYFDEGLSINTQKTYNSGKARYEQFEEVLLLFISHLGKSGLSHKTIKVYLAAVRNMHVTSGLHEHFSKQINPRLELVLKDNSKGPDSKSVQLPIMVTIMDKIHQIISTEPNDYNHTLFWDACNLAFFGFLRCSEFTSPLVPG